ncbi:MAG: phosphate/phosphite/phosphonate ABC transporter substrate-binding protein [Deltaproteobacteria bacterium]|nr:phosphate/phosphite/phosphonate ABC transporter substrate-binding protein [Deltaproteobacteria bacterium]
MQKQSSGYGYREKKAMGTLIRVSGNLCHGKRRAGRFSYLIFALVTGLLLLAGGCNDGTEKATVDFSKTMPVARPGTQEAANPPLRVAVAAMVSPKETLELYRQLLTYLGHKLGKEVELVQRKTYAEVNELLGKGLIDLAFVCSGPYVTGKDRYGFILLAVPEVHGHPTYSAYLIVNKESAFQRLEDLKGHTFAFTDPDSNTGRLVPLYWLAALHTRPETFFGRSIYTYSHDNSILAVARGLVDAASVDGLIWDYYEKKNPAFTSKTRVIRKSEPFGIPPLVASRQFPAAERERVQNLLFAMHQDPDGKRILSELMIDRFIQPRDEWYNTVRQMEQQQTRLQDESLAPSKP